MKFAIVRPREREVQVLDLADTDEAKRRAGLPLNETDHGTLWAGLGYICHEHAMFTHPQFYFALDRVVIGGNVVLFAYNERGETVDYDTPAHRWGGRFVGDEAAVEAEIKAGRIDRPQMSLQSGEVHWRWPAPMPDMGRWAEKVADEIAKGQPVQIDDVTIIAIVEDDKK